jgi:hypothetical protein
MICYRHLRSTDDDPDEDMCQSCYHQRQINSDYCRANRPVALLLDHWSWLSLNVQQLSVPATWV